MKRDIAILGGVGLLSVLAGIFVFHFTQPKPDFTSAVEIRPPEALDYDSLVFNDVNGKPHALTKWDTELQIINFWAPWCAPCRREIPALIELQQKHGKQLQIIGLAFDTADNVSSFTSRFAFNYPLLLVGTNSAGLNQFFGNRSGGLPFTVILDQQRDIVFQHAGEMSQQQLEDQIQRLLETKA